MGAIDTFLDAMFAPYPATPRLLEAKGELHAMMEDAYTDAISKGKTHNEAVGQVITDFGNLEELAPVLGILPDIRSTQTGSATAAPQAAPGVGEAPAAEPGYPAVTLPEAQRLAKARQTTALSFGLAVSALMCAAAWGPAFRAAAGLGGPSWSKGAVNLMSAFLTLATIACGVALLIRRNQAFIEVRHLTRGRFTPDPIVSAWAARLRLEHEPLRSRRLATAVALWILAALPPMAGSAISNHVSSSLLRSVNTLGPALSLLMIAAGLLIFLPANWAASVHSTLTTPSWSAEAEGTAGDSARWTGSARDWSRDHQTSPVVRAIAAIYWPLVTVVFLVWGIVFDGWDICWIIWPVAGVLFGGLLGLVSARSGRRVRSRGRRARPPVATGGIADGAAPLGGRAEAGLPQEPR